jgi:hypothetical protein
MAFGMDAGMRGYRRASPPAMRIMIAYRKASTRMRFRGDGMDTLSTSEVITTYFRIIEPLTTFCDTLSCFLLGHACIPYFIPLSLLFSIFAQCSVSTSRRK